MPRKTLNLGILAHVDAGKTTLTERLLHAAGVIDEIGSVDDGTTQTDSLALERQRGITIKSAVVSFPIDDVTVNLIDTPGHPDFIAEVERALSVLDGAVLVISAVEGVQPQTHILMRALRRLRVPTLIFVNKTDRPGADCERLLRVISERLTPAIVPMGAASELGTRAARCTPAGGGDVAFTANLAEVLAERSDSILAAYVHGGPAESSREPGQSSREPGQSSREPGESSRGPAESSRQPGVPYRRLREELAAQTSRADVHPLFFGSALTGAGVDSLMSGIAELLPAAGRDADGPASGRVFKIERGAAGEKFAYVRMFAGTVRTRDRVRFGRSGERKVTAINVFASGSAVRRASVSAGQIGKLRGLAEIQVGDAVGTPRRHAEQHQFAPPTLETVVIPRDPGDNGALRVALAQLAEQDPLINVRQDDTRQEISVSLYGEGHDRTTTPSTGTNTCAASHVAGSVSAWRGRQAEWRSLTMTGGNMRWSEMQNGQPRLAALGRQRLLEPGVVLVATIRRDGTPRISPVEPFVLDGSLWLSMLWQSTKAADLLRDPRMLVHSVVTGPHSDEGEFKIRGTASAEQDPAVQRRYADAVAARLDWSPEPGRFHLFAVSISEVTFIGYDDATGDQHVAMWPPAREFVRRGTSATSLGEPEPVRDIIIVG
jgi:small GTP-binding protein